MTKDLGTRTILAVFIVGFLLIAGSMSSRKETGPYTAIDGDTVRTGDGQRIRLDVIDAPEMPGHCRPGRICQPGDPYLAKSYLQSLLDGDMRCFDRTTDVYGRRISRCVVTTSDGHRHDLTEDMLKSGLVGYYRRS